MPAEKRINSTDISANQDVCSVHSLNLKSSSIFPITPFET